MSIDSQAAWLDGGVVRGQSRPETNPTTMTTTSIQIPSVGAVCAYDLDPQNKTQVASLVERAEAHFSRAARYWVRGNNSGNADTLAGMEQAADRAQAKGCALMTALGIKTSFPGLYPSFEVNGFTQYTVQNAVLAALGQPRDFLN